MDKNMIFFAADGKGLTSTSANHIANLAKEKIRGLESSLGSMVLFSTSVSLIGAESADLLAKGKSAEFLESAVDKLHRIARAKSLIAWLREAIKAKERMISEVEAMDLAKYVKKIDMELPKEPKKEKCLTVDDYFASLSLDERNRYYETETLAAVLGSAIHPDGSIAKAREELMDSIRNPRKVKGDGRDTLIYSYEPTVEAEVVDDVYFRLQNEYREAQARVNSFKFECEKAVKESEIAVNTRYDELLNEYQQKKQLLMAQMGTYKKNRMKEIGDYRIVIPASLKDIFDEVSHLGK